MICQQTTFTYFHNDDLMPFTPASNTCGESYLNRNQVTLSGTIVTKATHVLPGTLHTAAIRNNSYQGDACSTVIKKQVNLLIPLLRLVGNYKTRTSQPRSSQGL